MHETYAPQKESNTMCATLIALSHLPKSDEGGGASLTKHEAQAKMKAHMFTKSNDILRTREMHLHDKYVAKEISA
jgi:hypothetical protein